MATQVFFHPACMEHDPGPRHPECPGRLKAVLDALEGEAFPALERRLAPKAHRADLERVHEASYVISILEGAPETGEVFLDPDTVMSPASCEAAFRAAGAVAAAVDAVIDGEADNAFCAVRPPGHHAEAARAMGFCLFNNVAVGAARALDVFGLERVAIVDFDVHHGNGTQSFAERNPCVFYASTHQSPAYPGTGREEETGKYGNIVNVELAPGSGGAEFRLAYERTILPRLRDFKADLILVSAGFDAHVRDPLCQLRLATEDFAAITRELVKAAEACCAGRLVSTLEGGYDLEALAMSVSVHVLELMESCPDPRFSAAVVGKRHE